MMPTCSDSITLLIHRVNILIWVQNVDVKFLIHLIR